MMHIFLCVRSYPFTVEDCEVQIKIGIIIITSIVRRMLSPGFFSGYMHKITYL